MRGGEVVGGGVFFDGDVCVFVEEAFVVHLPGNGAAFAGRGVAEGEDFESFGTDGLSDGHPSGSFLRIHQNFDLAPFVRIKLRMR